MMKVILASVSALAFLGLAACDGGDAPPPEQPMDTAPQQQQPLDTTPQQ